MFLFIIFTIFIVNNNIRAEKPEMVSHSQWVKMSRSYDFHENYKTHNWNSKLNPAKPIPSTSIFAGLSVFVYIMFGFVVLALIVLIVILIVGLVRQSEEILPKSSIYKPISYINIENADLENDLKHALSFGLYKEAIRINYLMLIRTLNSHNMVIWKMDKTNGSYMREMYGKRGFDVFKMLTLYFDQVWYGDREISEIDYTNLLPVFDKINLIVTARE